LFLLDEVNIDFLSYISYLFYEIDLQMNELETHSLLITYISSICQVELRRTTVEMTGHGICTRNVLNTKLTLYQRNTLVVWLLIYHPSICLVELRKTMEIFNWNRGVQFQLIIIWTDYFTKWLYQRWFKRAHMKYQVCYNSYFDLNQILITLDSSIWQLETSLSDQADKIETSLNQAN
jgi:hypothetical protein